MAGHKLEIFRRPGLDSPRMLIGLSGWMDSGEVSTGTIDWLITYLGARKFAEIEPEGFYIYNFPGNMETSTLFRPYTKIVAGRIKTYHRPRNTFYFDKDNDLVMFVGKEPNLNWQSFSDLILAACSELNVAEIYFVGSVAGLIPHTRDPRIFCSVSDEALKDRLAAFGVKFSDYEGPASFITHLTVEAAEKGVSMSSLVATVPAYVHGENPKCVETMLKTLKVILGLDIELDSLRNLSDEFERRLTSAVRDMPELAETVTKLEADYDKEIFDLQMTDLQDWLHKKGIRLD